ncbi:COG4705 family protein [Streptomyces sp. 900105755]
MAHETSETTAASSAVAAASSGRRSRGNKVPEVTVRFWVTKVLCTSAGGTAADLLDEKAGLGLTGVSVLTGVLLSVVLVVQFRTDACRAGVYWPAVALTGVVGTLVSDGLTDGMEVPPEGGAIVFAVVLAVVLTAWYRRERTLSVRSVDTPGRESFYWLAVLCAFALGTAAGDLVSARMDFAHWLSAVLFALVIAAVALAHRALDLDAVWSFWITFVLTRPFGAAVGDCLSQPARDGGAGLGTVVTSVLFLGVVLGLVVCPAVLRKDVTQPQEAVRHAA